MPTVKILARPIRPAASAAIRSGACSPTDGMPSVSSSTSGSRSASGRSARAASTAPARLVPPLALSWSTNWRASDRLTDRQAQGAVAAGFAQLVRGGVGRRELRRTPDFDLHRDRRVAPVAGRVLEPERVAFAAQQLGEAQGDGPGLARLHREHL